MSAACNVGCAKQNEQNLGTHHKICVYGQSENAQLTKVRCVSTFVPVLINFGQYCSISSHLVVQRLLKIPFEIKIICSVLQT